jgi:ATP-binding protein involved in chromosome partitioning
MDLTITANEIELRSSDNTIRFYWADGHATVYKSRDLRLMCRCASCVDETTGRAILDPGTVPDSIEAANIEEVGNYGLRILWSSGHNTGIFTWERLRKSDPTHIDKS